MSSSRATPRRTLWEEGRHPGALVRSVAVLGVLSVAFVDVMLLGRLSALFDLAFVVTCMGAALLVRPRDFFAVGVLPPLMMLMVVGVLAVWFRDVVAEPGDGLVQALVTGLAHHAGALVTGYAFVLLLLLLRQLAVRNAGAIRSGARPQRVERPAPEAPGDSGAHDAPASGTTGVPVRTQARESAPATPATQSSAPRTAAH